MQENQDYSLTPEEVARQLQITRNTVYELVKRGELPAFRIGRKLRFDQHDVDMYKKTGKISENASLKNPAQPMAKNIAAAYAGLEKRQELVICGQDITLDILARHLERYIGGLKVLRTQIGSFDGLMALYHNTADISAAHLWDGDSGKYNLAFVRHLLPGIPAVLINLAMRMQGFYVKAGNPKNIRDWDDLIRPEIRFINREKGSGTRILLDEKFRCLGYNRLLIQGYEQEELSHLAVASAVARGEADVGLGNQKAAMQVREIEFIPLQSERYDLVIKKDDSDTAWYKAVIQILNSNEFQDELKGLGDYDLSETGHIIGL
ncbi:MAG: helix-turn-helix transcriptional regulator [Syntrophomonadaceae bacterium]|nr:helix-turn-helix transcriptional regulator [Syntrophomonadaceae bacterium]